MAQLINDGFKTWPLSTRSSPTNDALVTDPEDGWVGVDPTKLPEDVADLYRSLRQLGYWHGWNAAA